MGQAVTAVRELFSPQCPFLQKGQINEECVLGNVKNWENLSLADTSDLVVGRALVADAAVFAVLSLPGMTMPSVELLPCWKNLAQTTVILLC